MTRHVIACGCCDHPIYVDLRDIFRPGDFVRASDIQDGDGTWAWSCEICYQSLHDATCDNKLSGTVIACWPERDD